ncbi:hypothetical protein NOV72_01700 [Caballeronia novacaledonica]|uniref:Uncharacterized protein n=1 Tax=Caballeronia novacaledonica TaxID=1544861 RepID=A0A2U3I2Y2_9BURK|nr:DUF2000 family protein [Caballeronia novacaledonica]SPB14458.1 hypothetical protein NOV72_01700 [Caballeronia novacaledonica]
MDDLDINDLAVIAERARLPTQRAYLASLPPDANVLFHNALRGRFFRRELLLLHTEAIEADAQKVPPKLERCVIVVDEALPPGKASNAAAVVAFTLGPSCKRRALHTHKLYHLMPIIRR